MSTISSLKFVDPVQVIARVVAAETGVADVDAFRAAHSVKMALRRYGFDVIRRRFVAPGEEL